MYRYLITLSFLVLTLLSSAQSRSKEGWIDFGDDHNSKWLQIAPGKLGPNALPVPRMDYAKIKSEHELELGAHYHHMNGDEAINTFTRWYWNVAPERIAVEIYAYPSETFRMTNEIRDDRQIYYDDNGWTTEAGDLSISTYIQLIKNKKYLPDLTLNYSLKTTTGSNKHGRYTDAGMNYFYLAAGKSVHPNTNIIDEIRIAGLAGFYVWQTNKVEMAQDEGPVFELGIHLRKTRFNYYCELGGYKGYDAYNYLNRIYGDGTTQGHNDPIIFRNRLEYHGDRFNFKAEYQHGFRDYHYETFRLGVVYHFEA